MGNNDSKGGSSTDTREYGGLHIHLETPTAVPGETVSGYIYMDIKKEYPARALELQVFGEEQVEWLGHHSEQDPADPPTLMGDDRKKGRKVITDIKNDVYKWVEGDMIQPGHYSFPFSFRVPDGIPGSMQVRQEGVAAGIYYKLKATLAPVSQEKNSPLPRLESKIPLNVREKVVNTPMDPKKVSLEKIPCCCWKTGEVTLKTEFEKNVYTAGEVVKIVSEVDCTKSKDDIKRTRCILKQILTLTDNKKNTSIFTYHIVTNNFGPIKAGTYSADLKQNTVSIKIPHILKEEDYADETYKGPTTSNHHSTNLMEIAVDLALESKKTKVDFAKAGICPSVNGSLIKSEFKLDVICMTDNLVACDNGPPRNQLDIQIYAPAPKPIEIKAPEGWNPKVMPICNLAMGKEKESVGLNIGANMQNQMVKNPEIKNEPPGQNEENRV
jgi:hypothetical protein